MQFNNLKRACLLFFILITITVAFKAFAQQQGEPIYTAVEKSAIYPGGLMRYIDILAVTSITRKRRASRA